MRESSENIEKERVGGVGQGGETNRREDRWRGMEWVNILAANWSS